MKTKIATTIEQSKKLLELGLSEDTADLHYGVPDEDLTPCLCLSKFSDVIDSYYSLIPDARKLIFPAWSLNALLDLMPSVIYPESQDLKSTPCWGYEPALIKSHHVYDGMELDDSYYMVYQSADEGDKTWHVDFEADTPLEATYNMIVWLLENNYIKTEKI